MVQLLDHDMLKAQGITLIPASASDFFVEDSPTARMVRQILGAVSEFERATIIAKLKAARDRKRARDGKCEGCRSHREMNPQLVAMANRLRRQPKKGKRKSLRTIAHELARLGHVNVNGRPFAAKSIQAMIREG